MHKKNVAIISVIAFVSTSIIASIAVLANRYFLSSRKNAADAVARLVKDPIFYILLSSLLITCAVAIYLLPKGDAIEMGNNKRKVVRIMPIAKELNDVQEANSADNSINNSDGENYNEAMCNAIKENDIDAIHSLFEDGKVQIDEPLDEKNRNAIELAACSANLETLKHILQWSKYFDYSHENSVALHNCAISANSSKEAISNGKFLIKELGYNVSAQDANGRAPLHFAAMHRDVTLTKLILKNQCLLINSKDNDGRTPLHSALMHTDAQKFGSNQENATRLLIASGAYVDNIAINLMREKLTEEQLSDLLPLIITARIASEFMAKRELASNPQKYIELKKAQNWESKFISEYFLVFPQSIKHIVETFSRKPEITESTDVQQYYFDIKEAISLTLGTDRRYKEELAQLKGIHSWTNKIVKSMRKIEKQDSVFESDLETVNALESLKNHISGKDETIIEIEQCNREKRLAI